MRITVLGKHAPFPPAGGACSGYLLEHEGTRVLIECGSGVLSRLQVVMSLCDLTDVVLSHLHGDHTSDLMVLRYAADADLRHERRPGGIRVHAPPDPPEEFERLAYKEVMIPHAVHDGDELTIGDMRFRFTAVDHPFPCLAMTVSAGGETFAYSGDTAACARLVEAARGADLFLCEASLMEDENLSGYRGHLSAAQAGRVAAEAGVGALMLTHLWPFHDPRRLAAEAAREFRGRVCIPVEGATYPVRGPGT
ncbi:MAG: MBL fold metallo-hydrolase [Firmicutes bacterium]|nr:MBL fold metallo-hydrolase [Bacillota bacterium]